jgi:hypothetical protein
MSFSSSTLTETACRRALIVLVAGGLATNLAVVASLATVEQADARSLQTVRVEAVTVGTRTAPSNAVNAAAQWVAHPSILSVPLTPAALVGAAVRPLITLPGESAAGATDFAAQGFISELARRVDALARAAAQLKAEEDAAAAAAAVAAAAAAAAEAAAQAAAAQAAAQAAAEAAAQAAAQVAAQAAAQSAAAARAAQGYVQRVWTSGFQNEINQCRGAVDVTAVYKVRVIAEHSSCGGSRFPSAAGAIVTITGLDAGRYRVIGIVAHLNGEVNHAEDIPRGYDLLFQTCASGFTDMLFTALERIG